MMPATLMVYLMPGADVGSLLKLTSDIAAKVGARKVIGISALRPLQLYAGPDAYVPPDLFEDDWKAMEKEIGGVEKQFHAIFAGKTIAVEWRSIITIDVVSDYVAQQMRAADLLITSPTPHGLLFDANRYMDVADLALKAGRPVLVAGPGVTKLDLGSVLVGWNDSREARRAVEDALPLLRLAGTVTVAEVADRHQLAEAEARVKDVVGWLGIHNISAAARIESRDTGDDSDVISGLAKDLKVGLLVAGAYGHTRLREWVLGGVTRDLLMQPAAGCSFVSH